MEHDGSPSYTVRMNENFKICNGKDTRRGNKSERIECMFVHFHVSWFPCRS